MFSLKCYMWMEFNEINEECVAKKKGKVGDLDHVFIAKVN